MRSETLNRPWIFYSFSTGEKEMVILEREAYAFTSGIALGTVLFKVSEPSSARTAPDVHLLVYRS